MPVLAGERIVSLDVLRGFAILGILMMNVQSFGLPIMSSVTPSIAGGLDGVGLHAWLLTHTFFEFKFMSLFSILFGAGIVVFATRAARGGRSPAAMHYRRMVVLLGIGLLHAYAVWYGDILVAYSIIGMLVFLLRRLSVRWLIALGGLLLLWPMIVNTIFGVLLVLMRNAYELAQTQPEQVDGLTRSLAAGWQEILAEYAPSEARLEQEIAAVRGSYADRFLFHLRYLIEGQTVGLLIYGIGRVGGLMLIGMAMLKSGVLSAQRSDRFYRNLAIVSACMGFPLIGLGAVRLAGSLFDPAETHLINGHFNYMGSIAVALCYLSLVMLAVRRGWGLRVQRWLAAVGRTALSNYLLQSLIGATIFYGWGFGLFATMTRPELIGVVVAIWCMQITLSVWWLRIFRMGPMEWVWRSLSYGVRPDFLRKSG